MGRIEKERDIDGEVFIVNELNAEDALLLSLEAGSLIAPAIAAMGSSGASVSGLLDSEVGSSSIAAIAQAVVSGLDKAKIAAIRRQMMTMTHVRSGSLDKDGAIKTVQLTPPVADLIFKGKLMLQFKWLCFALEVQLGPFIDDLRDLVKSLMGSPA